MDGEIVLMRIGGRDVMMRLTRWSDGGGTLVVAVDAEPPRSHVRTEIIGYGPNGEIWRREHAERFRSFKDAQLRKLSGK